MRDGGCVEGLFLGFGLESVKAVRGAEVVVLATVFEPMLCFFRLHGHPANRVGYTLTMGSGNEACLLGEVSQSAFHSRKHFLGRGRGEVPRPRPELRDGQRVEDSPPPQLC
jgi:hypothetical protein